MQSVCRSDQPIGNPDGFTGFQHLQLDPTVSGVFQHLNLGAFGYLANPLKTGAGTIAHIDDISRHLANIARLCYLGHGQRLCYGNIGIP